MASKPTAKLVELCKELDLDDDILRKYMKVFQEEIKLGLDASTVDRSSLKCYVTYVQDLPTGDERGKFLALDLGGTNFRVLLLKKSRRYFDVRAKTFRIPKDIMRATGEELVELLNELDLSNEVLGKYRDVFIDEIKLGLDNATVDKSSLKCYVTYVQDIPDENVRGKFLAIDLGGTNFRVLCIKLAKSYLDMRSKKYQIPESLMKKSGEQLFDHIADCLYGFTVEHKINQDNLPLGFTFSFPCEQRGLEVGILKQWTKGFSCPGVEGENVVQLLREAIKRKKDLVIDVVAVLNDTTGTLMSCAWKKTNTKVGLIIGTGTNICYVEKTKNVAKFDGDTSKPIVLINTESGAFGGGGQVDFVRTKWDVELDAESINPGVNIMEKMISGMYLGDFVRRVLLTAVERQFIFDGVATEKLKKMGTFESKYVSDIEEDLPGQHDNARKVLGCLGYGSPTEQDCVDLHYASFIAWQRAGRMVSAGMAAILNHMQYDDVTIGVDGSLYRFHPGFADLMNKKIRELTDPHIKFKCILAEDGSGRGAALVAASVRKFKRPPGAGRPGSRGGRPSSGGGPDSKENRDSNGSAGLSPNHSVGPGDSLQKKPRRDGDGTDTERRRSRPSVAKDVSAPIDKKKDDDIDEEKDRHKDTDDGKKNENDEENTMKEDTEKGEDIDDSGAPLKDARKPSTHEDDDDKFKEKHGKEEDEQNDGSQMGDEKDNDKGKDDEKENDGKDGGKKESDKMEEDNKENDEDNRNDDHHIDGFHAFGFARKNVKDHEKEKDTDDDETNGKEEEASIDENDVAAASKDKEDNRKTDKKEPRENTYELMKREENNGKERIDEKDAKPDDEGIRKDDKEEPRENTHELMKAEENDRKERIDEKDAKPDDEGIRKDDKEKPREKLDEGMGGKEKDDAEDGRAKVDEKDAKSEDEGIRKDDKEKPREKLDEGMGGKEKDDAEDGRAKVDEKDAKSEDEGIRKDDKEEPREKLDEGMGGKEKDDAEDGRAKVDEKDAKPDDEGIRKDDKEEPREKLDEGMEGQEKDEAEDGRAKVDEKDAKPDDEVIRKDDKEEPREKLDEGMEGQEKDEAEDGRAKVDEKDAKPDNEREDDDRKDRDDQNKNEDKIEVNDNKRKPCKSVQERMRMKEKENEEEGKDGKDGKYLKPDDENKDEKAVDKEDLEPNVLKDHEERDRNKGNKEDDKDKNENGERKDKTDDNDNTRLEPNEPMLDDPKGPHKDKTNDENNDEIRDEEKKKNMNDDKEKRAQEEEKENEKEKKEENEKGEERGKDEKEKE